MSTNVLTSTLQNGQLERLSSVIAKVTAEYQRGNTSIILENIDYEIRQLLRDQGFNLRRVFKKKNTFLFLKKEVICYEIGLPQHMKDNLQTNHLGSEQTINRL